MASPRRSAGDCGLPRCRQENHGVIKPQTFRPAPAFSKTGFLFKNLLQELAICVRVTFMLDARRSRLDCIRRCGFSGPAAPKFDCLSDVMCDAPRLVGYVHVPAMADQCVWTLTKHIWLSGFPRFWAGNEGDAGGSQNVEPDGTMTPRNSAARQSGRGLWMRVERPPRDTRLCPCLPLVGRELPSTLTHIT